MHTFQRIFLCLVRSEKYTLHTYVHLCDVISLSNNMTVALVAATFQSDLWVEGAELLGRMITLY